MEALHRQLHVPEILANALNQDETRPLIQLLGGPMMTVGDVRDAASQFVQALASLGLGPEGGESKRIGLLSANLPEVLHLANACSYCRPFMCQCIRSADSTITNT